jgi:hypothetical protein
MIFLALLGPLFPICRESTATSFGNRVPAAPLLESGWL